MVDQTALAFGRGGQQHLLDDFGKRGCIRVDRSRQWIAAQCSKADSNATTLPEIIQEMLLTTTSERQGRLIDHDQSGSMEKKKKEGYF